MFNKLLLPNILFFTGMVGLFGLTSCEKEVDFHLNENDNQVVVEGTIETDKNPVVKLSKSIGFFENINLQTLSNTFIHDAQIFVWNQHDTIQLKEYTRLDSGFPTYYYTVDSTDPVALNFKGQVDEVYFLSIKYKGKTYTAQTKIPRPQPLDSIWSIIPPASEMPEGYPDSRKLFGHYTDPDTPGNRIRYFVKRNHDDFMPPLYSVFDDQLINGTPTDVPLASGFNKMDSFDRKTFGYFYKGDTVIIKWCAIDQGAFNFWQTLEFSYSAVGNPFAAPIEISTNISGGALGVWSGYGTTFDSLIISE